MLKPKNINTMIDYYKKAIANYPDIKVSRMTIYMANHGYFDGSNTEIMSDKKFGALFDSNYVLNKAQLKDELQLWEETLKEMILR